MEGASPSPVTIGPGNWLVFTTLRIAGILEVEKHKLTDKAREALRGGAWQILRAVDENLEEV